MSRPEANPIQLPDSLLQALGCAELLLLRLSAQLELARLAFDSADEAARDFALTHASELTRQLREAFNLAISGYEHEVVVTANKLEDPSPMNRPAKGGPAGLVLLHRLVRLRASAPSRNGRWRAFFD
jgi:hypothetical protein